MVRDDLRRTVSRAVDREFRRFRASMYRKSRPELWEACGKIHFYCCLREYFRCNDEIQARYYALLCLCRRPLSTLWDVYLKYESLSYTTWEGIDGIMEALFEQNRGASAVSGRRTGQYERDQNAAGR